jgi:chaperonin GroES
MKNKTAKIIPRLDWVLVKPDEIDKTTGTGLIIPSSVKGEEKAYGKILEIGKDVKDLKKGDTVIFGMFAGEKVQMTSDDEVLRLLKDDDIIAFII